ncbi:MAG: hypothetical protein QXD86_01570 [Candidatus Bathyarchaeia archaeon]
MPSGDGVRRLVYGLRRVSGWAVETEDKKLIERPLGWSDCRSCALLDLVCEELEYPCQAVTEECLKDAECDGCEEMDECVYAKPCCWECEHLFSCLECARSWAGDGWTMALYGVDWETFIEAIKMLFST